MTVRQTDGLVERLMQTEKRKSYFATNRTAPPIESEYDALINPDGPEAADIIEGLHEALRTTRGQVVALMLECGHSPDAAVANVSDADTALAQRETP